MTDRNISHYRILEELGRGGMGVVFKAEDTTLRRTVALKFLNPLLLAGEGERKRFVREAQSAAALSHPSIATVFAIEEENGQSFIALEYIEGQSLDKKIAMGPLKVDEALNVAVQLSEGLHAAHEKGIIHRDVKSANVMMTAKGQVKILDFGLAKLKGGSRVTKDGAALGTMAYMSPEQLRGDPVDQRTDIWSVGVVLYEMIAGRSPFNGDYDQALAYQIMNEQPEPLTAIRAGVPMDLERIVTKATAKESKNRYQRIDEMLVDLRTLQRTLQSSTHSLASRKTARLKVIPDTWKIKILWGVAACLALAALAGWWQLTTNRTVQPRVYRFTVPVSAGAQLVDHWINIALSRDGSMLAYVEAAKDTWMLCVRSMDNLEARRLPGTNGAYSPAFSPDGRWIVFSTDHLLRKISLLGGAPVTVFESADRLPLCSRWGEDDSITFSFQDGVGIWRVAADGGKPRQVIPNLDTEWFLTYPELLPGEGSLLFTSSNFSGFGTSVFSQKSRARKRLVTAGGVSRFLPTGQIVFGRIDELYAAPFDLEKMELLGPVVSVVQGIRNVSDIEFTISENGTLAFVAGGSGKHFMSIIERDGKATKLPIASTRHMLSPRFSPDGTQLFYATEEQNYVQWVFDLRGGVQRRFSEENAVQCWGVWTRDGAGIVYNMHRDEDSASVLDLYKRPVDRGTPPEQLTKTTDLLVPTCLSPDGERVIYTRITKHEGKTYREIKEVALTGAHEAQTLLNSPGIIGQAVISPDSRWMAYVSEQSESWEVYVQPYHAIGKAVQVSSGGGFGPLWSPDGMELFFASSDNRMMVARISGLEEPIFNKPQPLFKCTSTIARTVFGRTFDISPDGKRFVVIEDEEPPPPAKEIVVVVNWFEELKKKMSQYAK